MISYICRYLIDNSLARVSSVADYTISTSENAPEKALTQLHLTILTGSDDKDDDNHVSIQFVLLPAKHVLYEDPDIRPRQPDDEDPTWHDGDRRPINAYLNKKVFESDPMAKQIQVVITKSGNAHWHFGFDFSIGFEGGSQVPVAYNDPNQHNFGDNYNRDSWTFNIPWANSSQEFLGILAKTLDR